MDLQNHITCDRCGYPVYGAITECPKCGRPVKDRVRDEANRLWFKGMWTGFLVLVIVIGMYYIAKLIGWV